MLTARGITKRYPGVTALDSVDFSIAPGEVVGLIGENGAGKSTMIKTLGGLTHPDAGAITVNGVETKIVNAAHATKLGIGVIHQELNNLDNLDVAGNVLFGREPRKLGCLIDRAELEKRAAVFLKRVGLNIAPSTPLQSLSIAEQQLVEIAKALSLEAKLLIMDEPTSSLTAGETETLMQIVESLKAEGVGIVYVSHRLMEVKRLADRVVGFRDGKNAGELSKDQINQESMVRLMVGRDIERPVYAGKTTKRTRLKVDNLKTSRYQSHEVSFEVKEGEIVALAGLVGAGRSEVARAIFGIDQRQGAVTLDDQTIRPHDPRAAIESGIYLAPEDRRKDGVITAMTIRENVTMASLPEYAQGGLVSSKKECQTANEMRDKLRIKAPTIEGQVRNLSGGNQQKVVLAKWLSMRPKCLIVDEPTRGIDIGARSEIYAILRSLADEGVAILMISSDMEEVLTVGDRILVMREGRLTGELSREEANEEAVMRLAVGSA